MSNLSFFRKIILFLKDILSPKKCYGCKKEGKFLCEECFEKIEKYSGFCCICKKKSPNFKIHKKCLIENRLFNGGNFYDKKIFLDRVIIMTHYKNNIIKRLIKNFKFYGKKDIGIELGEKLGNFVKNKININLLNNDGLGVFVVSVPLHWFKKLKRGFNQSEILAENFAKINNFNYDNNIIIRKKYTRQQSKLSRQERLTNLENAFKINKNQVDNIDNKIVILVDDVFTTGSTLNEISKILKQNGAKKVIGICIASN